MHLDVTVGRAGIGSHAKLDEREGVALGFVHQLFASWNGERREALPQQPMCCIVIEAMDVELAESALPQGAVAAVANRDQHYDCIGLDTSSDKGEGVRGRLVQPVRILDDEKNRSLGRGLAEKAQHSERNHERLVCRTVSQPERAVKGRTMKRR